MPYWPGLWSLYLIPHAIGSSFRLRAGSASDLPAEAAEDGEETQDHVGQGQGINNVFPGKVSHLRTDLRLVHDVMTCGPGERCTGFSRSKRLQRDSQRPHPRTAPSDTPSHQLD